MILPFSCESAVNLQPTSQPTLDRLDAATATTVSFCLTTVVVFIMYSTVIPGLATFPDREYSRIVLDCSYTSDASHVAHPTDQ